MDYSFSFSIFLYYLRPKLIIKIGNLSPIWFYPLILYQEMIIILIIIILIINNREFYSPICIYLLILDQEFVFIFWSWIRNLNTSNRGYFQIKYLFIFITKHSVDKIYFYETFNNNYNCHLLGSSILVLSI